MRTYKIISADGHVEVPADRLLPYIPEKHRALAPELVTKDDGTEWWRLGEWERNSVGNLVCDLPYDEFTVEQIAGDLLPNATVEQKVATGFLHRYLCYPFGHNRSYSFS